MLVLSLLATLAAISEPLPAPSCRDCPEVAPVDIKIDGRPKALMVGRYELTWREYLMSVEQAGCSRPRNYSEPIDLSRRDLRDDYPVTSISQDAIDCYLRWIRERSGKAFRLPTEREWEAIAMGGSPGVTTAGAMPDSAAYLRSSTNSQEVSGEPRNSVANRLVQRVGQLTPDANGLYDVFGNASEAVSDVEYAPDMSAATRGQPIRLVVSKGGHVDVRADRNLISGRNRRLASAHTDLLGYRVVYDAGDETR